MTPYDQCKSCDNGYANDSGYCDKCEEEYYSDMLEESAWRYEAWLEAHEGELHHDHEDNADDFTPPKTVDDIPF